MAHFSDDFFIEYKNESELSYLDDESEFIELYKDNDFVGYLEVWSDKENLDREYVIINNTIIYLDTIKQL